MKVILVENAAKLKILYSVDCSFLKTVVMMNPTSEKLPEKEGVKGSGLKFL